ncbi:MAG: UvrD-helicase domain-containing protein [Bacteroidota bacterium]
MSGLIQYKSSAGSGKTFQLVLEYLKIVLKHPYTYRQVLAITFTNKATDEMKSRIIEALHLLAHTPVKELAQEPLYQLLNTHFEQTGQLNLVLNLQARKTLSLILDDYSNFSIYTIESFFQRVLRAFSRELNIPLGYEIELRRDETLNRLIRDLSREIGTEEAAELTLLLKNFVERKLEEEKGWKVEGAIRTLGKELFTERFQQLSVELGGEATVSIAEVLKLERMLSGQCKVFEHFMESRAKEALEVMGRFGLESTDFPYNGAGLISYFHKVIAREGITAYEPSKRLLAAIDDPTKWSTKSSRRKFDIEKAVFSGLERCARDMVNYYENKFETYNTAFQVRKNLFVFGLLNDLRQKMVEYRTANNLMLISDTNFLLASVITPEDTPFVFEKVGNRYQHYLIDEFQDTSGMQWSNLYPLVLENLAIGSESLIVGDVKQSIYRWRNGNLRLLLSEVEQQVQQAGQVVTTKHLTQNWRTAPEVVRFNNRFFEQAAELLQGMFPHEPLFQHAYTNTAQEARREDYQGMASIEFLPDKRGEYTWIEKADERLLEIISQLREDGFQYADITLLVRNNREGIELANLLQQHQIGVISSESLILNNHPHVRLLVSLLRAVFDPNEPLYHAEARFYLQLLRQQEHEFSHQLFSKASQTGNPLGLKPDKWERFRHLSPYECLEQLLRQLPEVAPTGYVLGLMDIALEFTRSQEGGIGGFLTRWEEVKNKAALSTNPAANAVQIMTIHKAKGLEFPVVILPRADWDLPPKSGTDNIMWVEPKRPPYTQLPFLPLSFSSRLEGTWFKAEYEEEVKLSYLDNLNLLYVAFTRPKYRLYVLTKQPGNSTLKGKIKRTHHLIHAVVEQNVLPGSKAGNEYRFGAAVPPPISASGVMEPEEPAIFSRPQTHWGEAVRIRLGANRYLTSSMLERSEKILAGELLHEALAHVHVPDDISEAVERLYQKGYFREEDKPALYRELQKAVSFPEVAHWFTPDWTVKTEADIISESGRVLRPDRINIQGNEAVVIDYKTGRVNPKHKTQVQDYMHALSQLGYQEVTGYVYYTSEPLLVEVT